MKYVLDTTVIIKGLVKPRRRKQDSIFLEEKRLHEAAASILDTIQNGDNSLIIPVIAVIETAAVSARLTGVKKVGVETGQFIKDLATEVISENTILSECIENAAETKVSGFDSVFITAAQNTNSLLITDDKRMHETAIKIGVNSKLLRDMT